MNVRKGDILPNQGQSVNLSLYWHHMTAMAPLITGRSTVILNTLLRLASKRISQFHTNDFWPGKPRTSGIHILSQKGSNAENVSTSRRDLPSLVVSQRHVYLFEVQNVLGAVTKFSFAISFSSDYRHKELTYFSKDRSIDNFMKDV